MDGENFVSANAMFAVQNIAPTYTRLQVENKLHKTPNSGLYSLDGYSTDIHQKSRFSQESVQTNSNLTIVQHESCVGSTYQRHVTNLIRIG